MPKQQSYSLQLPSINSPMNGIQSGTRTAARCNSPIQEVFSNFGPAIEAGAGERFSELLIMPTKAPLLDPLDNLRPRTAFTLEQTIEPRKIASSEALQGVVQ